ncbi:MAG: ATP-binding protein [Myxococcales bacterium]
MSSPVPADDSPAKALRTVLQVAEALNGSTGVADVLERAVDAIVAYTRFPACGLFRLDATGTWLEMIAHRNLSPEVYERARRLPVEGSLTGHAIRTAAVVTSGDLASDQRVEPATRTALSREGYSEIASVPLLHQGKPLGAVNFIYRPDAEPPTPTEREILLGIGRTIAMALASRTAEEERRKLEEQVHKAEQLERLGFLAGGIAHDFNNLLTGLLGVLSLTRERVAAGGDARAAAPLLDEALKASERASQLVRQLLTFSKGGAPILRPTDGLPALVRESAEFSAHGSSVRLEFDFASGLPPVAVDAGQLAQVVQNLVINAIQASPAGDTVRVEVRSSGAPHEGGVCLRVVDRGHGIPADLLGRVFDPYVTTRPGGSGLGLATVRSVVERHGGQVEVESTVGQGTTFSVYLPATSQPVAPSDPSPAASEASSGPSGPGRTTIGGWRVLVMDDEPMILDVTQARLEHLGCHVVTTSSGEAAVAACERALAEGAPFDAVMLDLTVVGGMGGRQAMERIRALLPTVAAVVSSGYSQDGEMASYERHGFDAVLEKPYKLDQLVAALLRARERRATR